MVPRQAAELPRVIRLMVPDIEAEDIEAVVEVLRGGHLVQGEQVRQFEALLAKTIDVDHVVTVNSGTAALHLALQALEIGPGDAVAVPAYTWPATANVVALVGADPVFVDIEPSSWGMDPYALQRVLASDGRIKAIMPVHAFGRFADIVSINEVARACGIPIVEDAACALGATLVGRGAGSWGDLGCVSFHPRKVLTTGEGGAVATNDGSLAARLRMLRNHGLDPTASSPDFKIPGYNLRLTEFQASLGRGQLLRLERILGRRRALAAAYSACFADTPVEHPRPDDPAAHTYQSYVVLLPRRLKSRHSLISTLRTEGIETTIGTHHVPLTTYFRERYRFRVGDFPVTDDVASRALTLPLHRDLDEVAIGRVAATLLAHIS
jgi:dTDP-4-amino-4,6-dideoxygalactose transaminase